MLGSTIPQTEDIALMLPVSALHFLVQLAYLLLGLFVLKSVAIRNSDNALGKALGFLTF